jgi:amidohydrolase
MYDKIKRLSDKYGKQMITLRRHLHQIPEVGLLEFETKKSMAAQLKKIGLKVNTDVWRTAIVAMLEGQKATPCVAIRSDMDALPVTEKTGLFYASKNRGCMHACGHDAHMAMVWGAAKILSHFQSELPGSVKFIFQPSEEEPPGGALPLIAAGVLEKPKVDAIFGVHVDPTIPIGKVGLKKGPMMAKVDDFNLTVVGRSGHAARPHETVDAVVVAAELVNALQTISSRMVNPLDPVILTIGKIEGGTARNIIADHVTLFGTARALDDKLGDKLPGMIKRIADGVCKAHGASHVLDYRVGYPVLANDPAMIDIYEHVLTVMHGKRAVQIKERPGMGAEDFACYLQETPGAMFLLGIRNKSIGADKPWHHPEFKIDEKAIPLGASLLAGAVMEYFERNKLKFKIMENHY